VPRQVVYKADLQNLQRGKVGISKHAEYGIEVVASGQTERLKVGGSKHRGLVHCGKMFSTAFFISQNKAYVVGKKL
jgi:hypothetical protein